MTGDEPDSLTNRPGDSSLCVIVARMDANLTNLRKTSVEKLNQYLVERQKTFETRKEFSAWTAQQYVEMQAEHAWLNAKQAFEIELYNAYGQWESVPPKS
jgi:hypothetical protein